MTPVRQGAPAARAQAAGRTGSRRQPALDVDAPGASRLAQVRLRADELQALHAAMHTLHLGTTSDALREGVRLLVREAAEVGAAENIRAFYADETASLPDAVLPPTAEEIVAADDVRW